MGLVELIQQYLIIIAIWEILSTVSAFAFGYWFAKHYCEKEYMKKEMARLKKEGGVD